MDRRSFARTMMMGAVGLGAAPVLAQGVRGRQPMAGMMPMGPAEQRHVADTLAIGTVSLESSRLAQSRAARPMVRRFANFEAEEAAAVAQILREMSGMAPPPLTAADRAALDRLARARGPAFDREYILAQSDGHRRLLQVQDRYLAQGRNMHHRHVAVLARGRILEHISDLDMLNRERG